MLDSLLWFQTIDDSYFNLNGNLRDIESFSGELDYGRMPENENEIIYATNSYDYYFGEKIEDAIKEIKLQAKDKVTVDYCYILDEQRKLLGTISLRQILLSSYDQYVYDIMKQRPKYVTTNTDQEEVAHKMQKYDINTIAVVDSEKRLVGIITIDDIVDVLEDETTEDIEKMAAIRPSDKPYMSMNTFEIWRKRIPWIPLVMLVDNHLLQ